VPPGQALLRSGARAGDDVWVSGSLGDARLALEIFRGTIAADGADFDRLRLAMERPEPRVALGLALRGVASSAIDLSDGLSGDIGHVLRASGVGATLDLAAIPCSERLAAQPAAVRRTCLLGGGDDYELLFAAPASARAEVEAAGAAAGTAVTRIGTIDAAPGLRIVDAGVPVEVPRGFDHFVAS